MHGNEGRKNRAHSTAGEFQLPVDPGLVARSIKVVEASGNDRSDPKPLFGPEQLFHGVFIGGHAAGDGRVFRERSEPVVVEVRSGSPYADQSWGAAVAAASTIQLERDWIARLDRVVQIAHGT